MNYNTVKKLVNNIFGSVLGGIDRSAEVDDIDPTVAKITQAYDRISESSTVTPTMKDYARRLTYYYLPAVECNYQALTATKNTKVTRLNRSVESIREESLECIHSCLLDIEHGAVFKDNLGDVFLNVLIVFEQQLEARAIS